MNNRQFENVDDRFGNVVYTITTDEIEDHVRQQREVGLDHPNLVESYDFLPDGTEYATLVYAGDYPESGEVAFIERNEATIEARLVSQ